VGNSDKPYFETLITTTDYRPGFTGEIEIPDLFPVSEGITTGGNENMGQVKERENIPEDESGESEIPRNYYYLGFILIPILIGVVFYRRFKIKR
jgi:hypothetical protein